MTQEQIGATIKNAREFAQDVNDIKLWPLTARQHILGLCKLLEAAHARYAGGGEAEESTIGKAISAAQKVWDDQPIKKAVVWARNDETGQTLVYTRGEYSDQLINFVHSLEHRTHPAPAVPENES